MKMSMMITTAVLVSTITLLALALTSSVPTLCSAEQGVSFYLKLSPANANAVIYENDGVPHAIVLFKNGRITMSPGMLPVVGKVTFYRGVEMCVDGNSAWAEINGILISGKKDLVKKSINAAISGNNVYRELKRIKAIPEKNAVEVYVLNRDYCPYADSPKVVVVTKDSSGYTVQSFFMGKTEKVHVSSLKLAFCKSMEVSKVLYFNVTFSKWG